MTPSARLQLRYWVVILAAAASLIGASLALARLELSLPARLTIAAIPVLCCGFLAYLFVRVERSKDEMSRRIQFEALAWAFPISFVGIIAAGSLTKALQAPNLEILDASLVLILAYCIGYVIAHRRYQ